jgi:hypothetical protein
MIYNVSLISFIKHAVMDGNILMSGEGQASFLNSIKMLSALIYKLTIGCK